ncbi:BMP family protein [Caldilinea sp.]|uniref:BMP family lipoprotein n=1 Tax=Caldilinea sp. TaxID=2293560 RepID=UPI002C239F3D|nr:BMP family protein [Caldilinea sp.]HRA64942.1 BMP family protein [Caldilinea sp.]
MLTTSKRAWGLVVLLMTVALMVGACAGVNAPAAAPAESGAPAAAVFKVGLVHPSPVTDAWSGQAYAAIERMRDELGAEIANVEVADPAGYEKAFSDFASQGYTLVIGHGFQYQDAAAKVSPDFPNTYFTTVGGDKTTANFAPIDLVPGYMQALYAMGVMAGEVSKTKQAAGFTLENPATKLPLEGFRQGFESIPGNTFSMIVLRDGNDIGAGKEAALQAMAGGADILIANANLAGDGVLQAVAEEGGDTVFAIGAVGDQTSKAPQNILASAPLNIPQALFAVAQAAKDGTFQGNSVRQFTVNDEGVYPFIYNPALADIVTPEMQALVDETIAKIKSGEIVVQ